MAFPALLDACVLVPITLTDLLLRLPKPSGCWFMITVSAGKCPVFGHFPAQLVIMLRPDVLTSWHCDTVGSTPDWRRYDRAHEMGIYKRYFDLIASGRKTIEICVNDSSRKTIKEGSLIRFRCR